MRRIIIPEQIQLSGLTIKVICDRKRAMVTNYVNDDNMYAGEIYYTDVDSSGKHLAREFQEYIFFRSLVNIIITTCHYRDEHFTSVDRTIIAKLYIEFLKTVQFDNEGRPLSFNSFGTPAVVEYNSIRGHDMSWQGICEERQNRIVINNYLPDLQTEMPIDKLLHVFHHELMHWMVVWSENGKLNQDENFINTLGLLFAQATPQFLLNEKAI